MSYMRAFEKQEGETPKAWAAFKLYRDMGKERTLRKAGEAYYGHGGNMARIGIWSRENDWVARVQAWDDYHEMIRNEAVEHFNRTEGMDIARRTAQAQEELLSVKEELLPKLKLMARWPLKRETITDKDGVQITNVYPAKWSFNTLVNAIAALDDTPDKLAFTDPTGAREYGQNPDEVRRLVEDILAQPED